MLTLHHSAFDPFSRKIRMMLQELGVAFNLEEYGLFEDATEKLEFASLPILPILVIDETEEYFCGHYAITECVDEIIGAEGSLIGTKDDYVMRARVRRLMYWFDDEFYRNVTKNIFNQKILNPKIKTTVSPDALRTGYEQIRLHLNKMQEILDKNIWLAGTKISMADISAAVQLSLVDYVGNVAWDNYPLVKEWYQIIKSRPSFQPFLAERAPMYSPSDYYTKLDF